MPKRPGTLASAKTLPSKLFCNYHSFNKTQIEQVRQFLLQWYGTNQRTLPWRSMAKDTELDKLTRFYAVWVSEVMLQQTQVATVINYFNKWIAKWPTLEALSRASNEEANQQWAGLGYYSRCRRLLEGAKKVVEELKSTVPEKAEELSKILPGVGKYTASAIASIVFGEQVGVVDGNVVRVLTRLRSIGATPTNPAVIETLWRLANDLVDPSRPGDFNQALMELGATVCKPVNPDCKKCPVAAYCNAYNETVKMNEENKKHLFEHNCKEDIEDTVKRKKKKKEKCERSESCELCFSDGTIYNPQLGVQNYPGKKKKTTVRDSFSLVLVIRVNQSYLLSKRPETGLLGGLFEFLNQEQNETKTTKKDVTTFLLQEVKTTASNIRAINYKGQVKHKFSHINKVYDVWLADLESDCCPQNSEEKEHVWKSEDEIADAAVSTAMKKVFRQAIGVDSNSSKGNEKTRRGDPESDDGSRKRKRPCLERNEQISITKFFVARSEKK